MNYLIYWNLDQLGYYSRTKVPIFRNHLFNPFAPNLKKDINIPDFWLHLFSKTNAINVPKL